LIEDAKSVVKERVTYPFFKTVNKLIKENFRIYTPDFDVYNACLEYVKEIMKRSFSWKLALYAAIFGTISSLLVQYGADIVNFFKGLLA